MKSFLEYVAEDILKRWGEDLSRTVVVFPNKRASLFLNEHLARLAGKPIWSPQYITISELFRQASDLTVADPILSVCLLHKSYTAITGIEETLDQFYGWGQLLLADFDDIDKNLAPVDRVFHNVRDIRELDSLDYLTDHQKEILKRFFASFNDEHESLLRQRFIKLWSRLHDIYVDYNERMAEYCQADGTPTPLAYEGHLYRTVIESDTLPLDAERYVFVGFNVVQKVEQELFRRLKEQGRAYFYWDYDNYYKNAEHNEAGTYIRQLVRNFPNSLDDSRDEIFSQMAGKKNITYLSAPTDNIQARYISQWLREDDGRRIKAGARTAIVMADEKILPTVLHSLPEEVTEVNITTGYPLQQTPVGTLVEVMMEMQLLGFTQAGKVRRRYEQNINSHPYMRYLSEDMRPIITVRQDGADTQQRLCAITRWMMQIIQDIAKQSVDALMQESLYRMYTLLNRIQQLLEDGVLTIDTATYQRLIGTLTRQTSIPFHGEPVVGIQIMGVLETRNLDFDNVLVLSCTDGNLPRGVDDSSFIPHSIRQAFDLTTVENKVAVYAYYFYSLLQRATDVSLAYNNSTQAGKTGEMSRFMLQLMVEGNHEIKRMHLTSSHEQTHTKLVPVVKTDKMIDTLKQRYDKKTGKGKLLSPSALNQYMRCQMAFYYKYIEGIKEAKEIEDEVDNKKFGDIFHKAAQLLYESLTSSGNKTISKDQIKYLLEKNKNKIPEAVDRAFVEVLSNNDKTNGKLNYNGLQLIYRSTIIEYVKKLLRIDLRLAPFTIESMEKYYTMPLSIDTPSGNVDLEIGGIVDRIDIVEKDGKEIMRIVDYKSGANGIKTPLKTIDAIFDPVNIKSHSDYYLQAMLYSIIVKEIKPEKTISPALLFIQTATGEDYDPTLVIDKSPISDITEYRSDFMEGLKMLISEIFNKQIKFSPADSTESCKNCPYAILCGREKR